MANEAKATRSGNSNMRALNFSSGPAMLPVAVLEQARDEMLSYKGSGMSVMEISHRSDAFAQIKQRAESGLRRLLGLGEEFEVLFMHGGATMQFSAVPMNLLAEGKSADYIVTGAWSKKAVAAAEKYGTVRIAYTSEQFGFARVPGSGEVVPSSDAAYLHYTTNETIHGVEFQYDLDAGNIPVVCDASSNILSRPFDTTKYSLIYAGAQKNLGPSGLTVVLIRRSLLERTRRVQPALLDYLNIAENDSMPNTPNTWAIYIMALVCEWLETEGGVAEIAGRNQRKAEIVYAAIDESEGFYQGAVEKSSRSRMNITFRLPDAELERLFLAEAEENQMYGLAGHRSVGGIRASMYNAFPVEGAAKLADFMRDFLRRRG